MAHKILVMSPLHNIGSTVVATMLAQGLTFDNKTSTLVFTQEDSNLPEYLGVTDIHDPTRSIMQVVRLIDSGAIEDKDILDYTYGYVKNGWLMNMVDPALAASDREQVIDHVYSRVPTDVVICDNSEDITSPMTAKLLEESDMLFIVTDMSMKCQRHLQAWLETPLLKNFSDTFIIVNRYDETVYALRNFAKSIKIAANRVCRLHYNPWIQKCSLNGQLHTILPLAREIDPRVSNLNNDVTEWIQCVNGTMVLKTKKGFLSK